MDVTISGWHARRTIFALLVALVAAGIGASAARAAVPLRWAPPVQTDSSGHALTALACQSVSLCVAVDAGGNVFSSSAPVNNIWSATASISAGPRLAAISCPSDRRCYAVDSYGNVHFGAAGRNTSAWTLENIDMITRLTAISCPSVELCVAVDSAGHILASTTPGVALTWSLPMPVDGSNRITAVSCPTASLCVAVDDAGNALLSTRPTSMPSWQRTALTSTSDLTAVTCNRSGLCVAVASDGNVYATADSGSAQVTWSATPIDRFGAPSAVSCTDVGLCVLLDRGGHAFESDNPAASRPSWTPTSIDPAHIGLTGVSCLSAGFCVAVDGFGDTVSATLPAPTVATGSGRASSQTTASLAASVNPNDAAPSGCRFDYGPTPAYGASVSCTVAPGATGGDQTVVAQLSGLTASTSYHFRIVASSAVSTASGGDATLATPAPLKPHPSLIGTPAVGSTLTCKPNAPTTAAETVAYVWLRDTVPIAGATAATHVITPAEQTHDLSCEVTISGDGGSASATAGFDAVPSQVQSTIIESFVGTDKRGATSVSAPVTCSPQAAGRCTITLLLTATQTVQHRRKRVTVGSTTTTLAAGTTRRLRVSLSASGRLWLSNQHTLRATFTVKGTVIGTLTATLKTDELVLGAPRYTTRHPH